MMTEIHDILGMTFEEAKTHVENLDCVIRVIDKDGEPYIVTQDYVANRVNVGLVGDEVVAYHFD